MLMEPIHFLLASSPILNLNPIAQGVTLIYYGMAAYMFLIHSKDDLTYLYNEIYSYSHLAVTAD